MIFLTADGKYLGKSKEKTRFRMMYKHIGKLEKGEYILFVDVNWDDSCKHDFDYMKIAIDIYSSTCSDIVSLSAEEGMPQVCKAIQDYSKTA